MKVPLIYPKIPDTSNCPLKKCFVFEKYDGTNLHWTFSQELGWYKFGTRRTEFSLDDAGINEFNKAHPGLEESIDIFNNVYRQLGDYPLNHKYAQAADNKEVTIFTEFLGDRSFAGTHQKNDPKRMVLIDAMLLVNGKEYFAPPIQFLIDFGYFDCNPNNPAGTKIPNFYCANAIKETTYSGALIEDIRNGKYKLNEGAVIKGTIRDNTYMVKVKTNAYMERLKTEFKDNWKDYWE